MPARAKMEWQSPQSMAALAGRILAVRPEQVLVCSTGVIGVPLPFERIERRSGELKANMNAQGIDGVSKSILTTDTVPKDLHG